MDLAANGCSGTAMAFHHDLAFDLGPFGLLALSAHHLLFVASHCDPDDDVQRKPCTSHPNLNMSTPSIIRCSLGSSNFPYQ